MRIGRRTAVRAAVNAQACPCKLSQIACQLQISCVVWLAHLRCMTGAFVMVVKVCHYSRRCFEVGCRVRGLDRARTCREILSLLSDPGPECACKLWVSACKRQAPAPWQINDAISRAKKTQVKALGFRRNLEVSCFACCIRATSLPRAI